MLVRDDCEDGLDFSVEAMTRPAMRTGRLVKDGEKRFLVRRMTDHGIVTVARCATMDQAQHVRGDEMFIEVAEVAP